MEPTLRPRPQRHHHRRVLLTTPAKGSDGFSIVTPTISPITRGRYAVRDMDFVGTPSARSALGLVSIRFGALKNFGQLAPA
jgi:hypothetical protein